MFSFARKARNNGLTAIVPGTDGTVIAHTEASDLRRPVPGSCEFFPTSTGNHALQHFQRRRCSTLLAVGEYQLLVVDAPEVPPEELRAAMRWRIGELIDFHIDDAVLDVFDAPPSGPGGNRHQLFVVVARSAVVRQRIDELEQAGINLDVIDIPELAMRNLATRLPEDETGLVTLYFSEHQCLITITRAGILYLSRNIEIGYRDLQENSAMPQALSNRLALEIQRSMDYYEQQYHQAGAGAIAILPLPVSLFGLEDALQQTLGLPARTMRIGDIIECSDEPGQPHAAACMLALGSALRQETAAL
jgi:MSHA biogenesis protein MshI